MSCATIISPIEVLPADDLGCRRDWSDEEKVQIVEKESARLSAGLGDGATLWIVAVIVEPLASGIPKRASERFRVNGLRTDFDFAAGGIFRDDLTAAV